MTEILLTGCGGKMGRAVENAVSGKDGVRISGGIDIRTDLGFDYPVFDSFDKVSGINVDVVIDFSNPSAFDPMMDYCLANKIPVVICTTGLSETQVDRIKEASGIIPVFYSGNMSLGINLLTELAKTCAKVLGDSFDIEIIEQHHNQKLDAPSGTALMIADAIKSQLDDGTYYEYDRHVKREKRNKQEIGIHAVRGGTIVGEHQVIFAGNDEIITLSHSARSKALFATGAVNAAVFMKDRKAGLYDMSDMLK